MKKHIYYLGPIVIAIAGSHGVFGVTERWRWLAPITRKFKIGWNSCEWCNKFVWNCKCREDAPE